MMGNDCSDNSGCLFPFGDGFPSLFGLLILNHEERQRRAQALEEEEEDEMYSEEDFDDLSDMGSDEDFEADEDGF